MGLAEGNRRQSWGTGHRGISRSFPGRCSPTATTLLRAGGHRARRKPPLPWGLSAAGSSRPGPRPGRGARPGPPREAVWGRPAARRGCGLGELRLHSAGPFPSPWEVMVESGGGGGGGFSCGWQPLRCAACATLAAIPPSLFSPSPPPPPPPSSPPLPRTLRIPLLPPPPLPGSPRRRPCMTRRPRPRACLPSLPGCPPSPGRAAGRRRRGSAGAERRSPAAARD